jgi:adenine-specific DNA-methyltransferase
MSKKKLGQYFTESKELKDKVKLFILNKPDVILEPSIGQGDLVLTAYNLDTKPIVDMYEIDPEIKLLDGIDRKLVNYCDFLDSPIDKKYKTIIGNPPYIKKKSYLSFIEKCIKLLDIDGELIFIVPSDFLRLTKSMKLIVGMLKDGSITHIYHPNNENLFKGASIDVIVFRYQKGIFCNEIKYNDTIKIIKQHKNTIILENIVDAKQSVNDVKSGEINDSKRSVINTNQVSDMFHVCVGMVSGRDSIFKHESGNINLLQGINDSKRSEINDVKQSVNNVKQSVNDLKRSEINNVKQSVNDLKRSEISYKRNKFILIDEYPTKLVENAETINKHLADHKEELLSRRIKKFTEKNWFEWGALRNMKTIKLHMNEPCLYIYNLRRADKNVAFRGIVEYFAGNLIILIPKNKECIKKIDSMIEYLNSKDFKDKFTYSGRFKISHTQISNLII